jgi:hypothetical protein
MSFPIPEKDRVIQGVHMFHISILVELRSLHKLRKGHGNILKANCQPSVKVWSIQYKIKDLELHEYLALAREKKKTTISSGMGEEYLQMCLYPFLSSQNVSQDSSNYVMLFETSFVKNLHQQLFSS